MSSDESKPKRTRTNDPFESASFQAAVAAIRSSDRDNKVMTVPQEVYDMECKLFKHKNETVRDIIVSDWSYVNYLANILKSAKSNDPNHADNHLVAGRLELAMKMEDERQYNDPSIDKANFLDQEFKNCKQYPGMTWRQIAAEDLGYVSWFKSKTSDMLKWQRELIATLLPEDYEAQKKKKQQEKAIKNRQNKKRSREEASAHPAPSPSHQEEMEELRKFKAEYSARASLAAAAKKAKKESAVPRSSKRVKKAAAAVEEPRPVTPDEDAASEEESQI